MAPILEGLNPMSKHLEELEFDLACEEFKAHRHWDFRELIREEPSPNPMNWVHLAELVRKMDALLSDPEAWEKRMRELQQRAKERLREKNLL
jgi:hypothetical protein